LHLFNLNTELYGKQLTPIDAANQFKCRHDPTSRNAQGVQNQLRKTVETNIDQGDSTTRRGVALHRLNFQLPFPTLRLQSMFKVIGNPPGRHMGVAV